MKRNAPTDCWMQRIENVVAEGMPDLVAFVRPNITCWIELKAPTAPRRAGTRLLGSEGMRPAQINWHLKAASLGIRSFVLIRDDKKRIFLVQGMVADRISDMTATQLDKFSIAKSWDGIFTTIRGL